jgi:hypothetical protein
VVPSEWLDESTWTVDDTAYVQPVACSDRVRELL